jgi:uncharacterized membrane protein
MITLQESIEIDRPVKEVYEYIVNVENAPKWQPAVIEVKRLTEGPIRVGTQFSEVAKMMGMRVNTICAITELEVDKKFGFKGSSTGPLEYEALYTLEPSGSATRLNIVGKMRAKGFWKLLEPIFKGEVKKESRQELLTMKRMIETRTQ